MKNKKSKFSLIKRFLPYYKKYKWIMALDLFCSVLTTVCELVLPLIVRNITGKATTDLSSLTVKYILTIGLIYLVLRIIDALAYYYRANMGHVMGARMETDMRKELFSHLQKLSFEYYDNTKIGTLMSRLTSDLFDVTEFAHHCPEEIFVAAIKIIASFIILSFFSPLMTLIVFAVIPPMLIVLVKFNSKMRANFRSQRVQIGEINSQIEDSLLGVRVVKSFANEDIEKTKFDGGNKLFLKLKAEGYKYMGGFHASTRFFEGFMYIAVLIFGAIFMVKGLINPADFVAYMLYVSVLFTSIRVIVEFAEQFQRGMTGIERFFEIMDTKPQITDNDDAKELTDTEGKIEFKNVTFRYSEENEVVLQNINLNIKAGENLALVGPSGGGKTTICSLIPRFYDIDDGEILIDGENIKDITLKSLRENIGVVQQDVYLFSGTVYDNIEYGKIGASKEEIIEAAKLSGAHEFIMELPNGYDTYVGERGVKLSGGQKQRISIARVFLKNPPILLLDEATSALDNESELIVQKSLEKLSKGRTTVTVAHRLTTIRNADKIVVLTADGIAEQGSHTELMTKDGLYSNLYKTYTEMK